ncbi:hypothetical protein [Rhizobium sp. HT1-10]|uniref:hypothetical protein n=1 Tax=Rhizobium sp. HT1-10 TaxID=3111638 RepID=UPI003C15BFFF
MKLAVAASMLLLLTSPAMAISRYNSMERTCGTVQQSIAREGAVLLRYPSFSGNIVLYDRYVTDGNQCNSGSYAADTSVPTKDNKSCPVLNCRSSTVLQPR